MADSCDFNSEFVHILKENHVLMSKSQTPSVKLQKEQAIQSLIKVIESKCSKRLTGKQVMKKINNMKTIIKKKKYTKAIGNMSIKLQPWEKLFQELLANDRKTGAMVAGFDSAISTSTSGSPIAASTSSVPSLNVPIFESGAAPSTHISTSTPSATSNISISVIGDSSASSVTIPSVAIDNNDDKYEDDDSVEDIDNEEGRGFTVTEADVIKSRPARIMIDSRPKKRKLQEFETDVTLGLNLSELQRYVLLKQLRVLEMQEQKLLKRQRVLDLEEDKLLWEMKNRDKRECENGNNTEGQTLEQVKMEQEQWWT